MKKFNNSEPERESLLEHCSRDMFAISIIMMLLNQIPLSSKQS